MRSEEQNQEVRGNFKMAITLTSKRNGWKKTNTWLQRQLHRKHFSKIDKYAKKGVEALRDATPVDTGKTAMSWEYDIVLTKNECRITWYNTNVVDDWCNVALILQYGHATQNGGWVEGIDYINPALATVFDDIKDLVWREVTSNE